MSYLYKKPTRGVYEDTYHLSNDDDDRLTCRTIIEDLTFSSFPTLRLSAAGLANLDYYFDRTRYPKSVESDLLG